ncbi:Mobile element transfer [Streptomyces sp. ISL-1]|uniref:mobile element transfer protein n=1 Tax=Streptomyces sp. ISL-1 TaxID=2817657 RepID=UPI001BE980C0|nr:mobile element transfer protein [Streptomyces sp. ISL-1]MBT2392617.1 Mobile element transfer [Streptomyces sp. ISL-1]
MPRNRFWGVDRIGPVQIGTHHDRHGRDAHATACTAPGCDWSADYLNRAAAELAARTHRCNPR